MPNQNVRAELRPLGLLERHATALHTLGYYNNLATSASYVHDSSPDLSSHHIHRAASLVIVDHPALSAIPVDEDRNCPYWARLPRFDLRDVVKLVPRKRPASADGDDELDEILETEHSIDFKKHFGELPFWRLVIVYEPKHGLSRFVACFLCHHAVGDGLSGLAFHRSFLAALSSLESDVEDAQGYDCIDATSCNYDTPHTNLLPSLESLHSLPTSVSFILGVIRDELIPWTRSDLWTAVPSTTESRHQTSRLKSFGLTSRSTSELIAQARANSTSVTGILEALLASAMFANLPARYCVLRCAGAMSFRDCLPSSIVNEDSMGTFLSGYVQEHHRPQASSLYFNTLELWNEARSVRRTIEKERRKCGNDCRVGLLRHAGDLYKFFEKNVGRARGESFELSNLGIFKARGESHGWKVGRMLFSQTANSIGCPIQVTVVTGGDGCLNIAFSWREDVVTGDWIEGVVATLKEYIDETTQT